MKQIVKKLAIEDIDSLSTRTKSILHREGIYTLQEFIDFIDEHGLHYMSSARNVGPKSIKEICNLYKQYSDVTLIFSIDTLSNTTKHILENAGITTLPALIDFCEKYGVNALTKFRFSGPKSIDEVRTVLSSDMAKQLTEQKEIQYLKSEMKKHKLAIVQIKAKLATLQRQ